MTDYPIIFSAAMVQALLDGRKTMTRRLAWRKTGKWVQTGLDRTPLGSGAPEPIMSPERKPTIWQKVRPGDRLWVRETWHPTQMNADSDPRFGFPPIHDGPHYAATWSTGQPAWKWRPSIHMPRWASRLTLVVTAVKIERLQDISEEDVQAEGICRSDPTPEDLANGCTEQDFVFLAPGTRQGWGMTKEERARPQWGSTAADAFSCLWNHLHGNDAWTGNPEVVAMTFTVRRCNIDRIEKAA